MEICKLVISDRKCYYHFENFNEGNTKVKQMNNFKYPRTIVEEKMRIRSSEIENRIQSI